MERKRTNRCGQRAKRVLIILDGCGIFLILWTELLNNACINLIAPTIVLIAWSESLIALTVALNCGKRCKAIGTSLQLLD